MKIGVIRGFGAAAALVAAAAVGFADTNTISAVPGTLNYVEGQASIDGRAVSRKSAHATRLADNQVLDTADGNAELLLTPGVFFRLGHNSEARMVSNGLADTRVELTKGQAMLEVDELYKENNLDIIDNGVSTHIAKKGLYEFDTDPPAVKVLDGQARVYDHGREIKVKGSHEIMLAAGSLKPAKFEKDAAEQAPLYRWSKLRSDYESQANVDVAQTIFVNGGGWYGPGWYWDPFWSSYAFLPGAGYLINPFGWGFYSPGWVGAYPVIVPGPVVVPGRRFHRETVMRPHVEMRAHSPGGGFHGLHGGRR